MADYIETYTETLATNPDNIVMIASELIEMILMKFRGRTILKVVSIEVHLFPPEVR